jgi:hypothetical protein
MARQERRRALFTQVHELYAQGWSCASIARMLGIHKKTAVKYASAEHFPESRSDRGRKLAPYLPFLQTRWTAAEHNIASLYQTIRTQGYSGSETSVRESRDIAPSGNRTFEATTKILSSRFEGEKATTTRSSFEPSCHLVGLAKT